MDKACPPPQVTAVLLNESSAVGEREGGGEGAELAALRCAALRSCFVSTPITPRGLEGRKKRCWFRDRPYFGCHYSVLLSADLGGPSSQISCCFYLLSHQYSFSPPHQLADSPCLSWIL